jgi:hypothetical protein
MVSEGDIFKGSFWVSLVVTRAQEFFAPFLSWGRRRDGGRASRWG